MDLRGRTAIVTGASRGIGKQAAIELGRRGANVVVAARTVEPRRRLPGTIAETVDAVRAVGATALAVQADMAVAEDLDRLVASTVEEFGGFDVLVNNAATASGAPSWAAPLVDLSRDDWMAQFAVNLHAPFTLTKLAVPIMRDRGGGRVINVTSGSIEVPAPDGSGPTRDAETTTADDATASSLASAPPLAYFSSKAALDRFCAIVAPQLEDMNISIVNLHPGAVRTEFVDILASQGIPTDHFIPMDVPARALAFIASCDDAMQFTGRVVPAEWLVERYNL